MKTRYLWIGIFLLGFFTEAHGAIEIGTGSRVITPDPLLPISGGVGTPAPAKEKRGELMVHAMVLRKNGTTVAIASVDALGFPSVLADRARAQVQGVPAENIMVGASHTHSAPDCYAFPDGQGGHTGDLDFMDMVSRKLAEAINEAVSNLQAGHIKIATGEAKGKIAYNYYAPDLYDRRVSVIQGVTAEGKVIATLVNYGVHPEVLGNRAGILSPDLVGPLRDRIESKVGGMAMFINGAIGGMITADNRDLDRPSDSQRAYWQDSRTWEECLRIGNLLADESLRVVNDATIQRDPVLYCGFMDVRFPVDSVLMRAIIQGSPLDYPHNDDHSITARINMLNLGNAQVLTIPGEAMPNIGFYLKRKMHGKHNMLFGLTNDAFGYILTKVDFNSFSRYDYVSRTSLGEQTGEILIEKSLELVDKSPRPE